MLLEANVWFYWQLVLRSGPLLWTILPVRAIDVQVVHTAVLPRGLSFFGVCPVQPDRPPGTRSSCETPQCCRFSPQSRSLDYKSCISCQVQDPPPIPSLFSSAVLFSLLPTTMVRFRIQGRIQRIRATMVHFHGEFYRGVLVCQCFLSRAMPL